MRYPFALGAVLLLVASPLSGEELPPLRTGIDGTFAPHAFPSLSGGYEGFNIDLGNDIARRLHRKIIIDAAQFSGLIPALQAGTYDFLIAPTTVTKERADNMLFTEGYLNTDFQFLIKKGSPKVTRLEDLTGKTVTAAEPGAGARPNHFSCSFAIVPSSLMHSIAFSMVLRISVESLRRGAAQTSPVE